MNKHEKKQFDTVVVIVSLVFVLTVGMLARAGAYLIGLDPNFLQTVVMTLLCWLMTMGSIQAEANDKAINADSQSDGGQSE